MFSFRNSILGLLAATAITAALYTSVAIGRGMSSADEEFERGFAVCPIVYPLDQSPSDRGFHYIFYGNGFFVNEDGYLLTAAHVLSQLTDNSPYVVLRLPESPSRFLKAALIAVDRDHDVALLQVTPNPFHGKYQVRFLPLAAQRPTIPDAVQAVALRPSRLRDPHTFDAFVEDRPEGQVLKFQFSRLDKGRPETELLLFGHDVLLGDSGAPVVSRQSGAVVGLVEGRWLRTEASALVAKTDASGGGVGAAVPIYYAISMLQKQGVAWHAADERAHNKGISSGDSQDQQADQALKTNVFKP